MANHSHGRRPVRSAPVPVRPAQEPPVRRWPHPVGCQEPPLPPEPTLHYIRCALSYQNQLLAEIKALLQQMAEGARHDEPES